MHTQGFLRSRQQFHNRTKEFNHLILKVSETMWLAETLAKKKLYTHIKDKTAVKICVDYFFVCLCRIKPKRKEKYRRNNLERKRGANGK